MYNGRTVRGPQSHQGLETYLDYKKKQSLSLVLLLESPILNLFSGSLGFSCAGFGFMARKSSC